MIKFFRRLRQKLLAENKISKYLIYAIGEIALVMIGILLALQVSNWKDLKNLKVLERSSLIEINNALEKDVEVLNAGIEYCANIINKTLVLKNHIKEQKPYQAYLDSLWTYPAHGYSLRPNRSAFTALENRGIELISNKTLRNSITKHYNVFEQSQIFSSNLIHELQMDFLKYYFNLVYPRVDEEYIKSHDIREGEGVLNEILLPIDYDLILKNPLIIAKLNHRMNHHAVMITNISVLKKDKEDLIAQIQKEINNPKK